MLNLASVLEFTAKQNPEKTALIFGKDRLTYEHLSGSVNQIANGLIKAGIVKGDKVALSCPNIPYFPMIYFAILKIGAVVVPLNILLKQNEIAYHLKDSEARAFFCHQGSPQMPIGEEGKAAFEQVDTCDHLWIIPSGVEETSSFVEYGTVDMLMKPESRECEITSTDADDTAVILYTSGTTGRPKGAELSHLNMTMNAVISRELLQLTHDETILIVLPLFHSFGQTVLMNAGVSMGNTLVILPRFTPENVLFAMQEEEVTVFAGVPTMYWQLLNYKDTEGLVDKEKIARTLKIGVSGAASMPVEIIRKMEQEYRIPIIEGYGLSETSPVATFNHLHKERRPGSVGTPIWGVDVDIVNEKGLSLSPGEVGEVVIKGHNVMKGYYKKPEATQKAFKSGGWFHTGDLGKLDEDGYLYIVDRIKDMIIRGGYNVYPREVEEILMTHPAVSLAGVIGVPDDRHGEEIKAFVVLKEGEQAAPEELVAWSKAQMANYKYPRIFEIRKSLPMTATGKILKQELRR